ncbi:hypothetical protein ITP53_54525 [Nonomuraea sp. K274]|uniref:Streptomyces killer toxin-like beta/gamma crystallin domain-containing protein n=1 Tax=Nonomuraea cypriaca TaxID=1187855 RepID=A0A931F7L8_9ACTN|nr:beta/gamma crystallin domain-containing protein [Nonomuraea cypriaca]MBF8194528.1 hypothetical protein [Nonomuraea cypriaca]
MKSHLRNTLAACATAVAVMVALPAAPAFAINHADCNRDLKSDFLRIANENVKHHCFANRGSKNVAIYGAWALETGNNKVVIGYIDDLGGSPKRLKLGKFRRGTTPPSREGSTARCTRSTRSPSSKSI